MLKKILIKINCVCQIIKSKSVRSYLNYLPVDFCRNRSIKSQTWLESFKSDRESSPLINLRKAAGLKSVAKYCRANARGYNAPISRHSLRFWPRKTITNKHSSNMPRYYR
ncbi:hypothetical protein PUN28_016583 [Cardiocondyla obscurior]|uniref:Uncharacterized protein n=1 Tax=Cardiocondyla obscurior TaxID=286306 RepID=A0AAW2EPJ0_9HYME